MVGLKNNTVVKNVEHHTPKVTQQLLDNLMKLGWDEKQLSEFLTNALIDGDLKMFNGFLLNEWNAALKNPLRKPKPGEETYNTPEDNWNELSNKEKEERLSGTDSNINGFIDLNTISKDVLVDALHEKIMFKSDSDSYIIGWLIDYYKKNSKRHISNKPEIII